MLSKTEEQLMKHLWSLERCFMKDLLADLPEPKPAKTTVATLLKRMIDKKFVAYRLFGNSREYYPLVNKEDYFGGQLRDMANTFFEDSPADLASLFTAKAQLSTEELLELRRMIDAQIKDRQ
jgi:predicted transcriptional regulator